MTPEKLKKILDAHSLWLAGEGGERADLSMADLRRANLGWADLREANLSGANLSRADLRYVEGVVIEYNTPYPIVLFENYIAFGCQTQSIEEWESLTEEQAREMDGEEGVAFWRSPRFKIILELAKQRRTDD